MMNPTPLCLLLALAPAGAALAEVPDPAVHAAARRLDAARSSVYQKRALELRVATPALLSAREGRADPVAEGAWRIVHPQGHDVSIEDVAQVVHRAGDLEEYPRAIGSTAAWVGAGIIGVAAGFAVTAGIESLNHEPREAETLGIIAGTTALGGLVTTLVGLVAHYGSAHEVPLSVATKLVSDYNSGIVDALDDTPNDDVTPAAANTAMSEPAVGHDRPAPLAGPVHLGVRVLDSDGVRVTSVEDGRAAQLRAGDLIVAADGIPIPTVAALHAYGKRLRPGDRVVLHVRRAGSELDVTVQL